MVGWAMAFTPKACFGGVVYRDIGQSMFSIKGMGGLVLALHSWPAAAFRMRLFANIPIAVACCVVGEDNRGNWIGLKTLVVTIDGIRRFQCQRQKTFCSEIKCT